MEMGWNSGVFKVPCNEGSQTCSLPAASAAEMGTAKQVSVEIPLGKSICEPGSPRISPASNRFRSIEENALNEPSFFNGSSAAEAERITLGNAIHPQTNSRSIARLAQAVAIDSLKTLLTVDRKSTRLNS